MVPPHLWRSHRAVARDEGLKIQLLQPAACTCTACCCCPTTVPAATACPAGVPAPLLYMQLAPAARAAAAAARVRPMVPPLLPLSAPAPAAPPVVPAVALVAALPLTAPAAAPSRLPAAAPPSLPAPAAPPLAVAVAALAVAVPPLVMPPLLCSVWLRNSRLPLLCFVRLPRLPLLPPLIVEPLRQRGRALCLLRPLLLFQRAQPPLHRLCGVAVILWRAPLILQQFVCMGMQASGGCSASK